VSVRIAIELGDPRGIGPEIVGKVMKDPPAGAEYVLVGPSSLIDPLPGEHVAVGDDLVGDATPGALLQLDQETAGRVTGAEIQRAAQLALDGDVQGIVTAPAEKAALHAAGFTYPGHTEWLAELAGGADVAMMLAGHRLRVVLVTTHLPLRDIFDALTVDRIVQVGQITREALIEGWGISEPRLAVCAVNPHAGEHGLFGSEDQEIIAPAAEQLGAAGPVPADTVFVRAMRGEFDAVLAPYHDIGMTAIKVAEFGRAVNVTLGLPFVRTSPDHGTAFDLAGRGIADPNSMKEAVALAVRLAERRGQQG
jgi:4-hydroxythreonine-4-phosphate dehydrogenase